MDKNSTLTQQVLRGSLIIVALSILASPLGYLIRIILSRSLTTEEFGLFYAVIGFFTFFSSYSDFGFDRAATYYIARFFPKKQYKKIWLTFIYALGVSLLTTGIIVLLSISFNGLLGRYYFKDVLAESIVPLLALYFLLESINNTFKNLFIGLKKVTFYSSIQPLRLVVTGTLCSILFITEQATLFNFALAWSWSQMISLLLNMYFLKKKHRFLLHPIDWNAPLFAKLRSYALPSAANGLIHQLNTSTDVVLLTALRGVFEVGVYNIIYPAITIPSIILSPLTKLFFPLVSSLQDEVNGKEKIGRFIEMVLKIIPFISLYFSVFIFMFTRSTIATLFTYKWVELAEKPLMFLSIAYVLVVLVSYLSLIIEGLGLVKEKIKITSALAVVNVVTSATLIYFFGVMGVIAANAIVQVLMCTFFVRLLLKHIEFTIPIGHYVRYVIFFGSLVIIAKLTGYWPKTLLEFLITGALYTVIVMSFASTQQFLDKTLFFVIKRKLQSVINRR